MSGRKNERKGQSTGEREAEASAGLRLTPLQRTAVTAASVCVVAVFAWPDELGVVVQPLERLPLAAAVGLASATLAGSLRRWGADALGAALAPLALMMAFDALPTGGRLSISTPPAWLWALVAASLAVVGLLRSRWGFWAARGLLIGVASVVLAQLGAGLWRLGLRSGGGGAPLTPPIVLLTLDTVRADHIAAFGGQGPVAYTPHLDALAARARIFTQAYSDAALTGPSHTTMLSGLTVLEHHHQANGEVLEASTPWVPEQLQAAGFTTHARVSAAVLDAALGFARGFDSFDSTFDNRLARGLGFLHWQGYRPEAGTAASRSGAQTLALTPSHPRRGSFTWVHLYDAHWPYSATDAAARRQGLESGAALLGGSLKHLQGDSGAWTPAEVDRGKALYRAQLEDLDALVGELVAGLPDDVWLIVAADHGESLGEHGYTFNHGRLPFAPDTRVPLMVLGPGVAPAVVQTPVSLARVGATLLKMAGLQPGGPTLLEAPSGAPVISVAFAGSFRGPRGDTRLGPLGGVALRDAQTHQVWTRWHAPAAYDPEADPSELGPGLSLSEAALAPLEGAVVRFGGHAAPEIEAELGDALKALGYVE